MPTVHREGPFSFVLFSSDRSEPPHIHVLHDRKIVKLWLEPVALARNQGFAEHEVNRIERLVVQHQQKLIEAWHDYFGT